MSREKKYFYSDGREQYGPLSLEELLERDIERDTLIWHYGLDQWKQAIELPELREQLRFKPPPLSERSEPEPSKEKKKSTAEQEQETTKPPGKVPKNWLVEAILATLFCCLPIGIVGIIYASRVESYYYAGKYVEAERASQKAGRWTKVAFFIGLGLVVLYFFLLLSGTAETDVQFRQF